MKLCIITTAIALGWIAAQGQAADAPSNATHPPAVALPAIVRIEPPEQGFYAKRLDCGGILIKAPDVVTNEALFEAARRIESMLQHLPAVHSNLARAGAQLHIIGKGQVTSDLPEHRHLKGKPFEGKLTVDERTRGLGGLQASCGEENLLNLPNDRYRGRDICRHEFAHTLFQYGTDASIRAKFADQRQRSLAAGHWKDSYAGTNDHEFFAELTMWYFGTHGNLHMSGPKPADGPEGLWAYDLEAFRLMDDFYSGRLRAQGQVVAAATGTTAVALQGTPPTVLSNRAFLLEFNRAPGGIRSLRNAADPDGVEFLRAGKRLGRAIGQYRVENGPWRAVSTEAPSDAGSAATPEAGATVTFAGSATNESGVRDLELRVAFSLKDEALLWSISLKNTSSRSLEIGDLALPLPMNTEYTWDPEETFVRRLFKHAFIAGHGSFLYWLPLKGTGPFLVMMPEAETSLEYFTSSNMDYAFGREEFTVFIHSAATRETQKQGTWRQAASRRLLKPGAEARYGFSLRWANSHDGVRQLLYEQGGVDVNVAPGMVVPQDLEAHLALRTKRKVARLEAEFPAATKVKAVRNSEPDVYLYRATFSRLGENQLTVYFRDGGWMPIEFFSTQPLDMLVRKRAAFITAHQQHRDTNQWYNGLFSLWDTRQPQGKNLLGPDNLGGQHPYAVSGSDDPSNCKCLLVAEKNVAYPDATEVAALEYFVRNFVWGKQQRTDQEQPYPYGIYGADSWKQNRFTSRDPLEKGVSRPGGPSACRMWRTFDYPTYFALYFDLYRIARQRPDLVHDLDAKGYLERAYGTARAFFDVPQHLRMEGGWAFTGHVYWQYNIGNFHEKYLLPLIDALEREGGKGQADTLRAEWDKKVKYFLYDHRWPFVSEMPMDSTAYESTYAIAHYALTQGLRPDTNLWYDGNLKKWYSHPAIDPARHEEFLLRQHQANLACRGVLESHYWSLGSDFRGCGSASYTLSYMSQMGGWSVLDYALRHDPRPAANLRLGYASFLSTWALMNTGDEASHYGFWAPGKTHDGALGWGFQPRQTGTEWNPALPNLPRGAWPVCGEADHGLVAAIETARTVLFDDPLFGLLAYGGELTASGKTLRVIPRDEIRQRFSALVGTNRLHCALDRDGFAREATLNLARDWGSFSFDLENRAGTTHDLTLSTEGLLPGRYEVVCGKTRREVEVGKEAITVLPITLTHPKAQEVSIQRLAASRK